MIKKYLDNFLIKFAIIIVLFSVIIFPQLKLIGLYFTGLDYLFYFIFLIAIFLKLEIRYEKPVMIKLCLISLIILFSLFTSDYINNYFFSALGFLIIILPFISYTLFYNINITKKDLIKVFKQIQVILFLVSLSVIVNLILGRVNDYGSPYTITKDIGVAATLCNVNIIISLVLFSYNKLKKHLFIIIVSFLAILLISSLKSIFMSLVVLLYYFHTKNLSNYVKNFVYIFIVCVFSFIIYSNQFITEKIKTYFFIYGTSDNSLEIARIATYLASANIAIDHFPLGSGPGTFGSYPVLINYNDLYYDYNLSEVWGMQEENLTDPNLPTFLLDTYWSSPLAETGIIGIIILLVFYFHPLIKIRKLIGDLKVTDKVFYKSLKFYISSIALVLLIENITLSSLSQVFIIILYFGLSGLIINFTKQSIYRE